MSGRYLNQPIPLATSFTENGAVLSLTTATGVRYDYWKPDNSTVVPSGSVGGTITDAPLGQATGEIPPADVDQVGETWKVQAIAIFSNGEFPAGTISFAIQNRGT